MSNTFGIKQSFRSQAIARKFARNSSPSNNLNENNSNSQQTSEVNVFENGNSSFASNVLNRKSGNVGHVGHVQISSNTSSYNNQNSSDNVSQDDSDKPIIRKLVNARLLHMKNYNKAVTRSADHM
jgi:hypothetical protein